MFSVVLAVLTLGQDCQLAQTLARQAYDERRYDQAATHFADAVTACGASAPLLLALGQAQLLARHPADALASLDRIQTEKPEYVPALKVKAKALYLLAPRCRSRGHAETRFGACAEGRGDSVQPRSNLLPAESTH